MKHRTKLKLAKVHNYCDEEDKSTEFMIALMMDTCNVSHNTVMDYLMLPEEEMMAIRREASKPDKFYKRYGGK